MGRLLTLWLGLSGTLLAQDMPPSSQPSPVAETRKTAVSTEHLDLKYYSTAEVVRPGLRFTLVADLNLRPKMHVYAPTAKGYIPISFDVDPSALYRASAPDYPKPQLLYLPAIQEAASIFQGNFQITEDLTMADSGVLEAALKGRQEVKIEGRLRYQACDDKICYLPKTIPLEWTLRAESVNAQRGSQATQDRPSTEPGK